METVQKKGESKADEAAKVTDSWREFAISYPWLRNILIALPEQETLLSPGVAAQAPMKV